jgi:hypothetical protein
VPQAFTIELDGEVTQPIKVNRADIRWLDNIVLNAENLTFYIATSRYTALELQAGQIPEFVVAVTVAAANFEGLTPGDINRRRFDNLANGTYYVCVSYANPLGVAFSNVLEFTVAVPPDSSNPPPAANNPFQVDGFPVVMLFGGILVAIGLVRKHR